MTITDATPGVTIYYTTNGTTPTTSSTIYKTGPIMVSNSETLRAIAIATNYSPSAVAWAGLLPDGDAGVQPTIWNLYQRAIGDDHRCDCRGNHLLHDRWIVAEQVLDDLQQYPPHHC